MLLDQLEEAHVVYYHIDTFMIRIPCESYDMAYMISNHLDRQGYEPVIEMEFVEPKEIVRHKNVNCR